MRVLLLLVALVAPSLGQSCDPASCMLPDCRCWDDKSPPGGLQEAEVPQIVMVTMENAINVGDVENYNSLFNVVNPNGCAIRGTFFVEDDNTDYAIIQTLYRREAEVPQIVMVTMENAVNVGDVEFYNALFNVVNPNGCAIRGTFFVEDDNTDYAVIQTLYLEGHEMGINTLKGVNPTDQNGWVQLYKDIKEKLMQNGVDENDILGARTEGFNIGGDDEFSALGDNKMKYDSSCVRVGWSDKDTHVWPFTLDFKPPACDIGQAPDRAYPGTWEMPIADLHDLTPDATPCPAPSACRNVTTKADAFDIFFKAFEGHYTGGRTPFMMVIDPLWAATKEFREGTIEFLDYIRATFPDEVWVVPAGKALQWIQDPVPLTNITSFAPWQCN